MQRASPPQRYPSNIAPHNCTSLATNASDTHIGGVMLQKSWDHWQPLVFFFQKIDNMESHYSTFDRELLDAYEQSGIFTIFVKVARISIVDRSQTALSRVSAPISP
jgi:hypothetical protein